MRLNPSAEPTIDFTDSQAVLLLNQALLAKYYQVKYWQLPPGYLCPPIPGRADYVHYLADLLARSYPALPSGKQVRLLDIGTGTGRMAELFAPHAERIVALDKNLEMLRVARAKLQHLPTNLIELVQGDFADLPFLDSSFDTVVLHQVLHFAADPAPALAEAARVLRSGGRIAIVDFASHDHEELRTRHQHVRLGFTDRQMAELLRGAGFSVSPPLALEGGPLVVKIWTAKRRPAPALKTPASLTETV